ncbi:MAG: alpha/beta hydrolase [Planctomycetaceae bacterium]|nr:alpha/beta hydrolase [Planctomycetaceae bacterium]
MSRLFLMSFHRRSVRLFGASPWLPLRRSLPVEGGEDVEFVTNDGVLLKGTYFQSRAGGRKGIILYCHELNGNRWSVVPYIESLVLSGFDLFTFDMRNHGESQSHHDLTPTPWVTVNDLEDVRAAINHLYIRESDLNVEIGLFGLSKGATVAACMAGLDSRVAAVVLDSPAPEGRLFEKNCWTTLRKSNRRWRTIFTLRYITLLVKAVAYSLVCPFYIFFTAWSRCILGYWFGCRFVSTRPLVRIAQQPIFIIHGNKDDFCRIDQVHAFCQRMRRRPNVWVVSDCSHGTAVEIAGENYHKRVSDFFEKSFSESNTARRLDTASQNKVPFFLRNLVRPAPTR